MDSDIITNGPGPVVGSPATPSSSLSVAEPACNKQPLSTAVLSLTSPIPVPSPTEFSCRQPYDHLDTKGSPSQPCVDYWTEVAMAIPLPPSPFVGPHFLSQVPEMPIAVSVDDQPDGTVGDAVNFNMDSREKSSVGQRDASTSTLENGRLNRPLAPTSNSAPLAPLSKLLPQDSPGCSRTPVSVVPPQISPFTSLAHLAHLIRSQGYRNRQCSDARVRHYRSLVSAELSARLIHCGTLANRDLADYLYSDGTSVFATLNNTLQGRKEFASLYSVMYDIKDSCDSYRRYSLLEAELGSRHGQGKASARKDVSHFSTTFMDEIPGKARDDLLDLLSEIRTNPDFLASRIASLEQQDLASLSAFGPARDSLDHVISSRNRTTRSAQSQQQQYGKAQVPTPLERLLSFQRHDPLSALVHTIFTSFSSSDILEDHRRTEIWASTCARLIRESKPGSDRLILNVLDIWSSMHNWNSKASMELYLLELSQKGQILLDELEDNHASTRGSGIKQSGFSSLGIASDSSNLENFYNWAVKRLFEVLDNDQDTHGLPQGVLELGIMILRKLDSEKHRITAISFIVRRWYISNFVFNVIKHPEAQGLLCNTYIGDKARQRILGEVANRAQRYSLEPNFNWSSLNSNLPTVQSHIDNIISSFQVKAASTPSISPQKRCDSIYEATETPPFLVICPSDLITIVKALFPERRSPSNQVENTIEISSVESTASSISGTPAPFRMVSDGSSILSLGASSVTSDTTSREPVFDCSSPGNRSSWTDEDCQSDTSKIQLTEQWGRRLRSACSTLAREIGVEACAGSCHPCAERWAVLYVSPDGEELTTKMPEEVSGGDAGATDRLSSNGYDDCDKSKPNMTATADDYPFLKEAISRLLNEYELPIKSGYENGTTFMHRSSILRRSAKSSYHVRADAAGQEPFSRTFTQDCNYDPSKIRALNNGPSANMRSIHRSRSTTVVSPADEQHPEGPSVLMIMLETAIHQCKVHSDFVNAHYFLKALKQLRKLFAPPATYYDYTSLLNRLANEPKLLLERAAETIKDMRVWSTRLEQIQDQQNSEIAELMRASNLVRDKMWYTTDVRHSRCYEDARNIVQALKTMGQSSKADDGRPTILSDRGQRAADANFLARSNAQYVSLLAAPVKLGGPRKLADEQSDMTYSWLTELKIENFCKGEERIHRFCLEINKCVNKLLGDDMLQGPVLWSSELYTRERDIFDYGQSGGFLGLPLVDALCLADEDGSPYVEVKQPLAHSFDFSSRAHRSDIKANFARDSSRQRSNLPQHMVEDLFSNSIPSLTTDIIPTLWSPIFSQNDKHTPRSTTSQRSRSAAAPSASLGSSAARQKSATLISEEKRQFLHNLRRAVTGLLLSDLGMVVFPHGSETDEWFSGDIGYACLQRKEGNEVEASGKEKDSKLPPKDVNTDRVAEFSLSDWQLQSNIRKAPIDNEERPTDTLTTNFNTMTALGSSSDMYDPDSNSHMCSIIATADDLIHMEFSYQDAFRRLLSNFATHTSPFKKLKILHELEQLVIASLTSSSNGTSIPTRTNNASDTLRLHNLGSVPSIAEAAITKSVSTTASKPILDSNASGLQDEDQESSDIITNDMIVDVYISLFRDPLSRPKHLFRDLQYIASFVSTDTLEKTACGQALWNFGLAALYLKQVVCQMMVEMADDIVAYNTQKRNASLKAASMASKSENIRDRKRNNDATEPTTAEGSSNSKITPDPSAPTVPTSIVQDGLIPGERMTNTSAATTASPFSSDTNSNTIASNSIPTSQPPSAQTSSKPPSTSLFSSLSRYTMADAAAMLLITAKEGHAVAERELATFYLSEPDLLPLAIAPLTRPRDVFKPDLVASVSAGSDSFSSNTTTSTGRSGSIGSGHVIGNGAAGTGNNAAGRMDTSAASGWTGVRGRASGGAGSTSGSSGNHRATDEKARSDPVTMCVAQHWMELSARGGDRLARTYLRAKDEMERIPSV